MFSYRALKIKVLYVPKEYEVGSRTISELSSNIAYRYVENREEQRNA